MIELRWKWQTVDLDDNGVAQKVKVLQYRTLETVGWAASPQQMWSDWMDVPTVSEE